MAMDVIVLNSGIPDGYIDFGLALYGEGKYKEASTFLEMSFKFPPCRSFPINPTKYTLNPMEILAYCYVELSRLKEAKKAAEFMVDRINNNLGMLEIVRICNKADKEIRMMDGIIELQEAVSYDDERIKHLLKSIPDFAFDHPTIKALVEKYKEKK